MTPHILTRSLDRVRTILVLVVAAVGIVLPLSNLLLPAGSMFQVPTYLVALFGKYVCYAILALSIDLIWGYCGILSLGHGAVFALCGGHVPDAPDRQPRRLRQSAAAGLHGVPELSETSVVLARL